MTSYSEFHEKIVDVKGKHPHFVAQIERTNPTYEDDFITWGGHAEGTGKVERRDEENLDELIRLLEDTFEGFGRSIIKSACRINIRLIDAP